MNCVLIHLNAEDFVAFERNREVWIDIHTVGLPLGMTVWVVNPRGEYSSPATVVALEKRDAVNPFRYKIFAG